MLQREYIYIYLCVCVCDTVCLSPCLFFVLFPKVHTCLLLSIYTLTNISLLQSWGVVHAISSHCYNMAQLLVCKNDVLLVLWSVESTDKWRYVREERVEHKQDDSRKQ